MTDSGRDIEATTETLDRRQLLRGVAVAGALGLGGVGLAACSGGGTESVPLPDDVKGKAIAKIADVPVGGGTILQADKIVVTQPRKGTFKAFTAVCTHQGCTVGDVTDGVIECPCHGSRYSITDGSVKEGPASRALREYPVTVKDGQVVLG